MFDVFGEGEDLRCFLADVELGIPYDRRHFALEPGAVALDFRRNGRDGFGYDFPDLAGRQVDDGLNLVGIEIDAGLDFAFFIRLISEITVIIDIQLRNIIPVHEGRHLRAAAAIECRIRLYMLLDVFHYSVTSPE